MPIITNGDHAAAALRAAFPGVPVLPWRDSLVDGPVRALAEEAFCDDRARYLADAFGSDYTAVRAGFATRRQSFAGMARGPEEIDLWFETDLFDQLQVIEILARLAGQATRPPVRLVQVAPPLSRHDLAALASCRADITPDAFAAAVTLWDAVTAPTPAAMARETLRDGPLSVVREALRRFLQELPAPGDGLARTERQALHAIAAGADTPVTAFRHSMAREELPFLGDAGFFARLELLATFGLIDGLPRHDRGHMARRDHHAFLHAPIALADRGHAVLAGQYDLATDPHFDRWVGGTHLVSGAIWRWDTARAVLVSPK